MLYTVGILFLVTGQLFYHGEAIKTDITTSLLPEITQITESAMIFFYGVTY